MHGETLFEELKSLGYTSDTPSYQEIVVSATPIAEYAYCGWYECTGTKRRAVWKKNAARNRRCPDCGHELSWKATLTARDRRELEGC